ncbi:MAG: hypothetical protein ACYDAC_02485 [Candidatus Dormibacteria bacterium]
MVTLTLDHNCLISLAEDEPFSAAVAGLVSLHDAESVTVHVVGVGASERVRGKELAPNYSVFEATLRQLGVAHLPVLDPPAILNVTFFDHCYLADESTSARLEGLSMTLFHRRLAQLARSQQCDVLSLFCHLASGNDLFVTADMNFHRKAAAVQEIGKLVVADPTTALAHTLASLRHPLS